MSVRLEMLGTARVALDEAEDRPLKATIRDQALAFLAITGDWVTRDRLGYLFWADSPDSKARHNVRQLLKRIRRLDWVDGLEADDVSVRWLVSNDVADLEHLVEQQRWELLTSSGELLPGLERKATMEFEEWLLEERRRVQALWETALEGADAVDDTVATTPRELVGRETELAETAGLLARPECRLLTLFGPGGIGKSTLARSLLDRMTDRYADGAAIVPLEATQDANDLPTSIATELEIILDPRAEPAHQLASALRDRETLIVLDNAEHLSSGWALFSQLLDRCSRLDLVVTSRERLRLEDEWIYEIKGLPDEEAVVLFLETAQRVAPEARVSADEALAVCRAVGGSPLGVELAAPWLRVMEANEIASEIREDLEILSGGHRDGLKRHTSVAAAIKHSWDLTSDENCRAVEALSVFVAPFTRQLASDVADVSATVLRDLIDQSLVQRWSGSRYSLHQLIRSYASSRLSEYQERALDIRQRHATALLTHLALDPHSPSGPAIEDVVLAWRFAAEGGDLDLIGPAVEGLTELMAASGRINRALELLADASRLRHRFAAEDSSLLATIRHAESTLLYLQGRHTAAAKVAEQAVRAAKAANDRRMLVKASLAFGWASKWIVGDEAQYEAIAAALPVAEDLDDRSLTAEVLNGLGCSAATLELCRDHLQRGLEMVEDEEPGLRTVLHNNLGMVLWALGEPADAVSQVTEALDIARQEANHNRIVESLSSLAFLSAERADLTSAQQLASDAESLIGASEVLDTRIYVTIVAGEIRRLSDDSAGARARAINALAMAESVDNQAYALRSLRLLAQLLIDHGEIERGLGTLAFVLSRTSTKGGDFTSEIINPRVWEQATAEVGQDDLEAAQAWANARYLDDVVAHSLIGP